MTEVWIETLARFPEIRVKLLEHVLLLTLIPVSLATLLGIPLAVVAHRHAALRTLTLGITGIVQTIPSLAMLAFLLPLFGIGKLPAIIALILYALLPIVQSTLTGLQGVPDSVLEAADGIGFSRRQRLRLIEIPLAAPVALSGIRTALVICVGVATLSTFIGAGGLGDFINRGLALNRMSLLLLGAGAAALLALYLDYALETLGQALQPGRKDPALNRRLGVLAVLTLVGVAFCCWPLPGSLPPPTTASTTIRIGSKNFTEQLVLGEIMAQTIEQHTRLKVERVFNLGGTIICHRALIRGEIDLYAEYTGTALTTILQAERTPENQAQRALLEHVNRMYQDQFQCRWLEPFGFNNTYALMAHSLRADQFGWKSISDLAPMAKELTAGFTSEFMERPDGYPNLSRQYQLSFGQVRDLSPELMYASADLGEIDVFCAFATDGRAFENRWVVLRDDRNFFPPYEAVPVMRESVLQRYPEIRAALLRLSGRIDDATMRQLNYRVEIEKETIEAVAREFLGQLNVN